MKKKTHREMGYDETILINVEHLLKWKLNSILSTTYKYWVTRKYVQNPLKTGDNLEAIAKHQLNSNESEN